jgi:DNA mismatch repair protein MutS
MTPYFDWAYEPKTADSALKKHFKVNKLDVFGCEDMPMSLCAAGALIQYLDDTQKNALTHINRITAHNESAYMMLDNNAIKEP